VLLEGAHLIEAAVAARWPLVDVWVDPVGEARFQPLLAQVTALGIPVTRVTTEVLAAVTETTSHQGIVTEVIPPEPLPQPWGDCDLVIADGIQDPGNVGALLRVAAAGVQPLWFERGALAVHLPLAPGVESLNVATAAAVFLFEAERQRRLGSC
jgi:TrmH family RNA methyltransferase